MALYELNQVVACGHTQTLVCQVLELPTPAEEIKQILKTVIIDNCKVIFDKVIVDGRLRKNIMTKAAQTGFQRPGAVQSCSGITTAIPGTLVDLDVEISFATMIDAPGAKPGDTCVFLQAYVEGEAEEPTDLQGNGTFLRLVDKSVVFLCVKVVRDVVTGCMDHKDHKEHGDHHGHHDGPVALCPPPRSTGIVLGAGGMIPPPAPGPSPNTWVGPTLLFPGILGPGIPNLVPPSVPPPTGGGGVIPPGVIPGAAVVPTFVPPTL